MSTRHKYEPLALRDICVECGEPLYVGEFRGRPWFTCGICGKMVCEECQRKHVPLCFAKIWGMVEEKEGELVSVEKPRVFTIK